MPHYAISRKAVYYRWSEIVRWMAPHNKMGFFYLGRLIPAAARFRY
jgi:hypothetical protein